MIHAAAETLLESSSFERDVCSLPWWGEPPRNSQVGMQWIWVMDSGILTFILHMYTKWYFIWYLVQHHFYTGTPLALRNKNEIVAEKIKFLILYIYHTINIRQEFVHTTVRHYTHQYANMKLNPFNQKYLKIQGLFSALVLNTKMLHHCQTRQGCK